MADTCATCRYFGEPSNTKRGMFACRRYPPTVHVIIESRTFKKDHHQGIATWADNTSDVSLWPMTTQHEWCGEFATRPTDTGRG